jgi:hypothetical protein
MPFKSRRSPRARLLLVVAIAHLAALSLLQAAGVWHDRTPRQPARDPLIVRLLTDRPLAARPPTLPEDIAPRAAADTPRRPARQADAVEVPAAAALPQPPEQAGETTVPAEPAVAPPRPLVLDLPRKASAPLTDRHPGLDDPRSNAPRQTLESRIARVVGSDKVTEEHLGDGRMRLRKGSECVELRPNAAGQLSPFNESVSPSNRLATKC